MQISFPVVIRIHSNVEYQMLYADPRMTSLLVETPHDQIRCDMPVEVVWQDVSDDVSMPYFRGR